MAKDQSMIYVIDDAASAQTWYGRRSAAASYNPWTGGYGATRQGHTPYAQWGQSAAVRGDDWARTGHVTTARGTVGGIQRSQGSGIYAHGMGGAPKVKTDLGYLLVLLS